MIREYIEAAMKRAHYEMIADEEPFYGEVPELPGVWATGKTLKDVGGMQRESDPGSGGLGAIQHCEWVAG